MLQRLIGRASRDGKILGAALAVLLVSGPVVAATYTATNSASLTSLLSSTVLGDTIILNAGTLYEGSFTLPNKTTGTGYITIQSSNLGSLPAAGTRVNLTHASNMPKIRPANTTSHVFRTATSAHHFKLIGLEITGPVPDTQPDGVTDISHASINLGDVGTAQDTLAECPTNIVIDRCIIRANSSTQRIRRGVILGGINMDVINSHISGYKDVDANDTQAIACSNGPGPYNIINNYLEAASENILFGGSDPDIANLVPSDVVITKNHFSKPLTWNQNHASYAGQNWSIKNLFEIKNGRNMTIEGNIFEHNWVDGQSGWSIVLTPANSGAAPWTIVENITFRNNIVRGIGGGPNILSHDQGGDPSGQTNRIYFQNNLWYDIGGTLWGNGKFLQTGGSGGMDELIVDHNTAFSTSNIESPSGGQSTNCEFTNNMFAHGQYGFKGPSTGNSCFNDFFSGPSGVVFQKNVMMDNSTYSLTQLLNFYSQYTGGWSPTSLAFPQSGWTGVLVNQASPGSNFGGYKVVGWDQPTNPGTYPYNNTGTDGKDIGCDIDALNTATAGCITGVWANPPTTITLKNGVNGYNGNTTFHVRGQAPTTHNSQTGFYHQANSLAGTNGFVERAFYKFDVSPAASGIPAGSTITSAKLRMKLEFRSHTFDYGISCFRMAPATSFTVNYSAATRNTYNGTNAWSGGANAAGETGDSNNDYVDTPVDNNSTIPAVGDWIEFDVASAVQAWVSGTANNGFLIKTNAGASNIGVRTSTAADANGSAEYPTLEVTYQ